VLKEPVDDAAERGSLLQIPGEELAHDRRLRLVDAHTLGVARVLRVEQVTVDGLRPRQQQPRPVASQSTAPHPLSDQRALVFGNRPTDLEQEVLVRRVAGRLVEELDAAAGALELFKEHHLMDVVAGEPVRRSD